MYRLPHPQLEHLPLYLGIRCCKTIKWSWHPMENRRYVLHDLMLFIVVVSWLGLVHQCPQTTVADFQTSFQLFLSIHRFISRWSGPVIIPSSTSFAQHCLCLGDEAFTCVWNAIFTRGRGYWLSKRNLGIESQRTSASKLGRSIDRDGANIVAHQLVWVFPGQRWGTLSSWH